MLTFAAAFTLFLVCVLAMAVGVIFSGKKLSGSCGGRGPDGEFLADCLCAREKREVCPDAPKPGPA